LESLGYGCPASKSVVVSGGKGTADFVLLPPAGPVTLSGAQLLNGRLRFQIDGTAGYDYIIERSADLFGWVTLLRTNSATLPFQFVDPDPPADPARFYRARPMAP
jgi:hypothetical protein